jgi:plasmid stabilization system protein ParE
MKRAVRWSRAALDDLRSQVDYIARENPAAARRVATRIPLSGAALSEIATGRIGRVPGTYEKVVQGLPYIIAYSIQARSSGRETIHIVRVIHGARNWPAGEWPA